MIELPDLDMRVGDTVERHLLWAKDDTFPQYFVPVVCYELSFEASSSDPSAVAVSVSDDVLATVALDVADSVRVGVTGTDTRDSTAFQDFLVRVRPARPTFLGNAARGANSAVLGDSGGIRGPRSDGEAITRCPEGCS